MKRIILSIIMTAMVMLLPAQMIQKTSIPFFDIVLSDGSHYRASDLMQGRPAMLVYFDPDCEHCEQFIKSLVKHTLDFKDVQVILVTYVPVKAVKDFVLKMGLNKFPLIKTGTEGEKFTVRYHYGVIQFPFVALHDKNGSMFANFEGDVPSVSDLAKMFPQ